jgi:hypothetical protein
LKSPEAINKAIILSLENIFTLPASISVVWREVLIIIQQGANMQGAALKVNIGLGPARSTCTT